jgi:regulator of sirC expression with transglutaminase-like and TPR domain
VSNLSRSAIRARFAEIVARDDDAINLAEAALIIAAEEYARLDIALYLEKLDHFGDLARERVGKVMDAHDAIVALNATLFEELGFRGNREHYRDPRNSFLNAVIDRRTGIPITLAVVYMEVARRIGLFIQGVGLPLHFVAKHRSASGDIFIDPFNGGRLIGEIGCAEMLAQMSGGRMALKPEHLEAVTTKQILTRMLNNLLGVYSTSDPHRALAAIERILILNPDSPNHTRDHGLLLALTGDNQGAISELELYLELLPDAPDAETIGEQIKTIKQNRARLN